jgi:hypothetical protein
MSDHPIGCNCGCDPVGPRALQARIAELAADNQRLRRLVEWATNRDEPYEPDDGTWECARCGTSVGLCEETDRPEHLICHPCCTDIVTELFERADALATPTPGNKAECGENKAESGEGVEKRLRDQRNAASEVLSDVMDGVDGPETDEEYELFVEALGLARGKVNMPRRR